MPEPITERIEVSRPMDVAPAAVFALLCDPQGHVAIDSSGMLQSADGDTVTAAGDSFVVHMDRESLGDVDLGRYDVTVTISAYEQDREIAWKILGRMRPQIGHVFGYRIEPAQKDDQKDDQKDAQKDGQEGCVVTSYYDWSDIDPVWRERDIFPVISEGALKATLGILERTVRRGYPRG
jgi:hypothetical protein